MVGGWRSLSTRSGCSSGSSAPQRSMMPPRLSTQEIEANAGASKLAFEWVAQAETMARQALANGYRLCAACSVRLVGMELCAHHTAREHVDSWAAGNRIWCEFVHGKWRARQGVPTVPPGQDPRAGHSE
jgi:hypothetical protein